MRTLLLVLLAASAASAQTLDAADPSPHSDASLVADVASIRPGDAFDLAVRIEVEDGWHVYWKNPGDSGQPVRVDWRLPAGVVAGPLRFPPPDTYSLAGVTSFAHTGAPEFLTHIAVPEAFAGDRVRLEGEVRWLVCETVCYQARDTLALDVPVGPTVRTGRLDAARALLPVMAPGWTAEAEAVESGYRLTVRPPAAWDGSLAGATFYPDRPGVLDHAAAQDWRQRDAWAAVLPAAAPDRATASRLRGVLVAADGRTLTGDARAIEIDALVEVPPATSGVWTALLLALAGGLLLNLMPCVFPILGIKVLGFVGGRDASPAALRAHGLAFGAGVLVSFLALAGVLIALRAAGEGLGWGFQLQSPLVVAALALLMTGLALNLLGTFEIGQGVAAAGGRLDRHEGLGGAFWSGVLATVVATPCTAPFMGAALGFALAQPTPVALAVFAALGVGMALPYVLLSFRPGWVRRLPPAGAWMATLRQVLAFPLLATAVWLVWVFALQTGVDAAALLLLAAVALALGAWAWGRSQVPGARRWTRRVALVGAVGAAALVAVAVSDPRPVADASDATGDVWEPFDIAAVDARVAAGEPVFIDFTAAWCLSCQVNKKVALSTDAVDAAFAAAGVTRVRADWTDRDDDITAMLARFGRTGVPLYVLYPGGGAEPVLLPEVLTAQIVLDALAATATQTAGR